MRALPLFATRLSLPLATAIAAMLAAQSVHAGQIWDGGGANNNWNTAANWDSNALPNFANAITFQSNTRNGAVNNLAADTTIGGIVFNNTGATNLSNAFTLSGARITLGGNITTTANTAGSTITDTISLDMILNGNRIITTNQLSDTVQHNLTISGIISEDVAGRSLTKAGLGVLNLTGANLYTGTTSVNAGTLNLGGGTANGSLSSATLTLGGGLFSYTRTGTNTQSFTTTNINTQSATSITGAAGNTLNLGTVARGVGATLNFATTGLGIIAASTASHDASGIMAGFTHGDSWAVANGTGLAISALASLSYTQSSAALDAAGSYTGLNIDVDSSQTPDAAITANSLRFSSSAANTLTLQGSNIITSGGILVGSGVGSNLSTITGGTLAGAASKDLSIIQNNTSGGLTISSIIANNGGATALTKSGAGLVTLDNSNTFTGGVFINAGTLAMANAGALNSATPNNVTYGAGSTGTLRLAGNNLTIPVLNTSATSVGTPVIENASASDVTLTINSGSNSTFAGIIQDGTGIGTLALSKLGAGTLSLSGANTYTGGTTLNGGTVAISNATAFGTESISVTGNSRINAAALTYANDISIDASTVLTLGTTGAVNSTSTFSGAITGDGGITLAQGVNSGGIINLSSTNNTFTGNITLPTAAGTNDFINFASIGDGGSIIFGRASWLANVRYTGAADLEFNTRTISLANTFGGSGLDGSGNPMHMFDSNGAGTVTINTAMGVTSTAASSFFYLGGSNAGNNTFAGAIADPTGANTLGIGKSGSGKWILSNNTNSFEGNVLVHQGTLSVGDIDVAANAQSLGKGSLIQLGYRTSQTAGTLEYTGSDDAVTDKQIQLGQLSNSTNSNFTGGGVILNNGDGTLTFSNATFNSTTGVPITGTGIDRTLTLSGSNTGANTISGTIQDNNAAIGAQLLLTKTGLGTWVLGGTNTYTGNTLVSEGTLQFAKQVSLYNNGVAAAWSNTNINVNSGATMALNIGGSGEFTKANVITLLGLSNATTNGFKTGAILGLDTTSGDFLYDSVIANPNSGTNVLGLTKLGTNKLTLDQTNTYTGATNVSSGTLIVNGNISTSLLTTVNAGATLGGTGTVGAATINGVLAPGNSIGTLNATGDVTWNDNDAWVFELGSAASTLALADSTPSLSDLLNITGGNDFLKGTGSSFTFDFAGGGEAGWYKLVDWTGSTDFLASNFFATNLDTGLTGTFTVDSGTSALYLNVIPEPRAALLGGLGLLALLRRRR